MCEVNEPSFFVSCYRLRTMADFATPTFLNAVNLLTSLDNLGISLIFGLPTKLYHAHIQHLKTHLTRDTGVMYWPTRGARGHVQCCRCEFR